MIIFQRINAWKCMILMYEITCSQGERGRVRERKIERERNDFAN